MATIRHRLGTFLCYMLSGIPAVVQAHGLGLWGFHPIEWPHDQLSQVRTVGSPAQRVSVAGKDCIASNSLLFHVRDDFAFDIDETVWLDLELRAAPGEMTVNVRF